MDSLAQITHLILDMDGVLYRGSEPMPRLGEFFAFLQGAAHPLHARDQQRDPHTAGALGKAGRDGGAGFALRDPDLRPGGGPHLRRDYPAGTRVHVFGMPALSQAMTEEGFVLADDDVKVVVASVDRDINFEKIKIASRLIRAGRVSSRPTSTPTSRRRTAFCREPARWSRCSRPPPGSTPTGVGKPEPIMYELAMAQMGARPETTAAVGDRVMTDIVGGKRAGLTTICVLSGAPTGPRPKRRAPISSSTTSAASSTPGERP